MTEYILKSGKKLTEQDIANLNKATENGELDALGKQGKIAKCEKLSNITKGLNY